MLNQEQQHIKWHVVRRSLQDYDETSGVTLKAEVCEWINMMNESEVRVRVWQSSMINFMNEETEAQFVLRFGSLSARP